MKDILYIVAVLNVSDTSVSVGSMLHWTYDKDEAISIADEAIWVAYEHQTVDVIGWCKDDVLVL